MNGSLLQAVFVKALLAPVTTCSSILFLRVSARHTDGLILADLHCALTRPRPAPASTLPSSLIRLGSLEHFHYCRQASAVKLTVGISEGGVTTLPLFSLCLFSISLTVGCLSEDSVIFSRAILRVGIASFIRLSSSSCFRAYSAFFSSSFASCNDELSHRRV